MIDDLDLFLGNDESEVKGLELSVGEVGELVDSHLVSVLLVGVVLSDPH